MHNQKSIKKIMKCTREGSYDELLNYIKEANDSEDLFALREHKIIQYIVDNTKQEKILKSYLERIKIIDNRHYVHEKNYIKLLKIVKKELCEISEKINNIVNKIDITNIYTNLYDLAYVYEEQDLMNIQHLSGLMCDAMDKIVLLKSRQTSINMDKFTQQLTEERDEDEIEFALILNLFLSNDKGNQNILSFSGGRESYIYYIKLIEEVEKYQRFYRIRDEVTYNKYYVENADGKVIRLSLVNLNIEKSKVSGQRRADVRRHLAGKNGRNEEVWKRYNLIIRDVADAMYQYYFDNGFVVGKEVEAIIGEIRNIIAEEFGYEDSYLLNMDDKTVEFCYSVLIVIIVVWKITENVQCGRDDFIKYYFPIFWEGILKYLEEAGLKGDREIIEQVFLYDKNKTSPYDLIYAPFIQLEDKRTYGIISICKRFDWSLFLRKRLVNGGIVAKEYGHEFEMMLSEMFEHYKWRVLERAYKIKQNGKVITDCDLMVYCKGMLLIVQAKAITKGKGPHDQWSALNTVKLGVLQAKKCTDSLGKQLGTINKKYNVEIRKIQPVVVTANYLINTVVIDDVPVISADYLLSLLGGAKVSVHTEGSDDYYLKDTYLPNDWKVEEFAELLYESYEWNVDLEKVKEKVKYQSCGKYIFEIPHIEETDVVVVG
ncbi:MAG: hypothetical protein ACLRLS_10670 [Roseburia intestinalis]